MRQYLTPPTCVRLQYFGAYAGFADIRMLAERGRLGLDRCFVEFENAERARACLRDVDHDSSLRSYLGLHARLEQAMN